VKVPVFLRKTGTSKTLIAQSRTTKFFNLSPNYTSKLQNVVQWCLDRFRIGLVLILSINQTFHRQKIVWIRICKISGFDRARARNEVSGCRNVKVFAMLNFFRLVISFLKKHIFCIERRLEYKTLINQYLIKIEPRVKVYVFLSCQSWNPDNPDSDN
jgi:hypothetical protein